MRLNLPLICSIVASLQVMDLATDDLDMFADKGNHLHAAYTPAQFVVCYRRMTQNDLDMLGVKGTLVHTTYILNA